MLIQETDHLLFFHFAINRQIQWLTVVGVPGSRQGKFSVASIARSGTPHSKQRLIELLKTYSLKLSVRILGLRAACSLP
jgi:hypothetical protein